MGFGQPAELVWTFACSAGVAEPISVIDNNDGSHTASYTPASDGAYTVCVKYADQEVPCRSVSRNGHVFVDAII